MRLGILLTTVPLIASFAACGSDESEGEPGATGNTTCSPGSTQSCTCNGSDIGAQACAADGKTWQACNCGAGGASGGLGGTGASGGSGGSVAGSGGSGASGGSGGVTDGGPDTGPIDAGGDADYTPGPLDDPCPVDSSGNPTLDINCSTSCGPRDAICDLLECNTASNPFQELLTKLEQLLDGSGGPFVIRLPANPKGPCVGCYLPQNPNFPTTQAQASYSFFQNIGFGAGLKIDVGAPWYVSLAAGAAQPVNCTYGGAGKACMYLDTSPAPISMYTLDANAPARNVTIRLSVKDCYGL
jgi:hypothetical protein